MRVEIVAAAKGMPAGVSRRRARPARLATAVCGLLTLLVLLVIGLTAGVSSAHASPGGFWYAQPSATPFGLNGISFVDGERGWAVGALGTVAQTVDGGATWTSTMLPSYVYLTSVDFVDATHGWAVGENGTILVTSDAGVTWDGQSSSTTATLNAVDFVDLLHGWAVGTGGTIVHTADGGSTWTGQYSGVGGDTLSDVDAVSANMAVVVGMWGDILITGDGGTLWEPSLDPVSLEPITSNWLTGVSFVSADVGWVVGEEGVIFHTADGGTTWDAQSTPTTEWLNAVGFATATTGWAVGTGSTVLVTADGGLTWATETAGTTDDLYGLVTTDEVHAWAVGGGGVVVATDGIAPTTGDDADAIWHNGPVTVMLAPTDVGAGVASTHYQITNRGWQTGTSVVVGPRRKGSYDGANRVEYYSVDAAGNTEQARSCIVRIDTTAPQTASDADGASHGAPVTVTLSSWDAGSGVAATWYSLDGGPWQTGTAVPVPAPADHSNDGIHLIDFYSVDAVGNTEVARTAWVVIDTVP